MADINTVAAAARRTQRSRKRLKGTTDRPRLAVVISNKAVKAQIIDDVNGKTLASAVSAATGTMTEKATAVGTDIATKAKTAKVKKVVFDRGAKQYHGRVQAVAEAARKAGLEL